MAHKSRRQKADEYEAKYGDIPVDYTKRLEYMYDKLHISSSMAFDIIMKRAEMLRSLQYYDITIILFEVPEGSPRPRFRIVNRQNLANMAIENPSFVHVYSITGAEDSKYMRRLIDSGELNQLNSLIYTPCSVDICAFMKTPSSYNRVDTILAEMGLYRPITKPDFDNIAKKYSDMFNKNVWLDDTLVVDGAVHKYYSILPRVEIRIKYMNMLYNVHQYRSLFDRVEDNTDLTYFK